MIQKNSPSLTANDAALAQASRRIVLAAGCALFLSSGSRVFASSAQSTREQQARLNHVGGRVMARGYLDIRAWRMRIVPHSRLAIGKGFGSAIEISNQALEACEHDGHIAALVAYARAGARLPRSAKVAALSFAAGTAQDQSAVTRADTMMIEKMARAGYDPRDSLEIWQKLAVATSPSASLPTLRRSGIITQLRALGYVT